MKLYFVHRNIGISRWLDQVMPNARWAFRKPKHLAASKAAGVVIDLAARLLAHLRGLPEHVEKVSSKEVKRALTLADDEATKKAFTRAIREVTDHGDCGWALKGRSLVRINFAYYFGGEPS